MHRMGVSPVGNCETIILEMSDTIVIVPDTVR